MDELMLWPRECSVQYTAPVIPITAPWKRHFAFGVLIHELRSAVCLLSRNFGIVSSFTTESAPLHTGALPPQLADVDGRNW
jgi:hypothetical protein